MRYKPYLGKIFYWSISILSVVAIISGVLLFVFDYILTGVFILGIMYPIILYLFIAPAFGYVEIKEDYLYIKYGPILRKVIPLKAIVDVKKAHALYCNGLINLKTGLDHLEIRYNTYNYVSVSLAKEDQFIEVLNNKIAK